MYARLTAPGTLTAARASFANASLVSSLILGSSFVGTGIRPILREASVWSRTCFGRRSLSGTVYTGAGRLARRRTLLLCKDTAAWSVEARSSVERSSAKRVTSGPLRIHSSAPPPGTCSRRSARSAIPPR